MIIKKQISFLIMTLGIFLLYGCAKHEGSIKNNELLGTFIMEGDSRYAYYIFDENGNKQGTCEWKALLSQNGKAFQSKATYEYKLEKKDDNSYSLHLKNSEDDNKYEAVYNISDDTISDETGTYEKQKAINEKAEIAVWMQGTWNVKVSDSVDAIFSFQNGNVSCQTIALGVSLPTNEGTYKIGETEIMITYDSGVDAELEYTYEDGILKLYLNGEEMSKR